MKEHPIRGTREEEPRDVLRRLRGMEDDVYIKDRQMILVHPDTGLKIVAVRRTEIRVKYDACGNRHEFPFDSGITTAAGQAVMASEHATMARVITDRGVIPCLIEHPEHF